MKSEIIGQLPFTLKQDVRPQTQQCILKLFTLPPNKVYSYISKALPQADDFTPPLSRSGLMNVLLSYKRAAKIPLTPVYVTDPVAFINISGGRKQWPPRSPDLKFLGGEIFRLVKPILHPSVGASSRERTLSLTKRLTARN
ncbi:hypothetical protein CEXT_201891 [Caerostris extrusa]|uniref:Uncharacterized protein n=1 Tax=Caerostris extrusa TaxID=172846 RepID=A0AAV4T524_CAEEX|nr:hypothetical protein CEXT_201891 [Caerostris extrusa]